jgi:hypothetical protein
MDNITVLVISVLFFLEIIAMLRYKVSTCYEFIKNLFVCRGVCIRDRGEWQIFTCR